MPEKLGNGGHGPENYDINTGKYMTDGLPNKYYDNPKETFNGFDTPSKTRQPYSIEDLINNFDNVISSKLIDDIANLGYNYEINTFKFRDGEVQSSPAIPNILAKNFFGNARMKLASKEEFAQYENKIRQSGSGEDYNYFYEDGEFEIFLTKGASYDDDSGFVKVYRGISVGGDWWDNPKGKEDLKDIFDSYSGRYPTDGFLRSGNYGSCIYGTVKKKYALSYAIDPDDDDYDPTQNIYGHLMEMIVNKNNSNIIDLRNLDQIAERIEEGGDLRETFRNNLFKSIYSKTKDEIKASNVTNQIMGSFLDPSNLAILLGYDAITMSTGNGAGQLNLLNPAVAILKDNWENGE